MHICRMLAHIFHHQQIHHHIPAFNTNVTIMERLIFHRHKHFMVNITTYLFLLFVSHLQFTLDSFDQNHTKSSKKS